MRSSRLFLAGVSALALASVISAPASAEVCLDKQMHSGDFIGSKALELTVGTAFCEVDRVVRGTDAAQATKNQTGLSNITSQPTAALNAIGAPAKPG